MANNPEDFTGYNKVRTDRAVAFAPEAIARTATYNQLSSSASVAVIAAGTAAITVNGILAGVNGQRMTIVNLGTGAMTIADAATAASAVDRILRQSTSTAATTGAGCADLVYVSSSARWILTNLQA